MQKRKLPPNRRRSASPPCSERGRIMKAIIGEAKKEIRRHITACPKCQREAAAQLAKMCTYLTFADFDGI